MEDRGEFKQRALLWAVVLLLLAGLACAQAGEVLTPAEATERAQGGPARENVEVDTEEGLSVGDTATLTGRGFLINILNQPGSGGRIIANQERGVAVTIEGVTEEEGEIWYQIEAPTGTGWVKAENLEPAEGTTEAGEEEEAEAEGGGLNVGDTVYLTGRGFLVNLYNEPGGRLVANQERGAAVTILEVGEQDGATWYRVDAPTGEGWVAAENVTAEAP